MKEFVLIDFLSILDTFELLITNWSTKEYNRLTVENDVDYATTWRSVTVTVTNVDVGDVNV